MCETAQDLGDDRLGFALVVPRLATGVKAVRANKSNALVRVNGRREGDQLVVVVTAVGKGDEAFLARAVVQVERALGDARAQHLIQDALEIAFHVDIAVRIVVGPCEEVGGGHLLGIADDDGLPSPRQAADGIPDGDLRGFVENDQVEQRLVGRQVLGDGQRRHHETRRQGGDDVRNFRHELPDRLVPSLFLNLVSQDTPGGSSRDAVRGGKAAGELGTDIGGCELLEPVVDLAEVLDGGHMLGRGEFAQNVVLADHRARPPAAIGGFEGGFDFIGGNLATLDGANQRRQLQIHGLRPAAPPVAPGFQFMVTASNGVGGLPNGLQRLAVVREVLAHRLAGERFECIAILVQATTRVQEVVRRPPDGGLGRQQVVAVKQQRLDPRASVQQRGRIVGQPADGIPRPLSEGPQCQQIVGARGVALPGLEVRETPIQTVDGFPVFPQLRQRRRIAFGIGGTPRAGFLHVLDDTPLPQDALD